MTTTKNVLDNYAENLEARSRLVQNGMDAMVKLLDLPGFDPMERQQIRDDIIGIAMWDAENDQAEIANLIAVANSTAFELETRTAARDRVITMLEL